jgi:ribonucleotide monophosphatase NagD (HAD superfamily)
VAAGTGSIVKCVETAAGREPDVICGKPHHPMVDILVETRGVDPARTLMIGDR